MVKLKAKKAVTVTMTVNGEASTAESLKLKKGDTIEGNFQSENLATGNPTLVANRDDGERVIEYQEADFEEVTE